METIGPNTMYIEKSYGGYWEAWTYADGDRIRIGRFEDRRDAARYARRCHYKLVEVA